MKVDFKLHKQVEPVAEHHVKVNYGDTKRAGYKLRWFAILFVVISPVVVILYTLIYPSLVQEAPAVLSFSPIEMSAPQGGIVAVKRWKESEKVNKGDVLFTIQNTALDAEITFLKGEVEKFSLDQSNDEATQLFAEKIASAKKNAKEMETVYRRYERFSKKGQVSATDFAAIINLANNAKQEVSSAKIAFALYKSDHQLAGNYANSLRAVKQQLVEKEGKRNQLTVRSPYDGNIIDINAVSGQTSKADEALMMIKQSDEVPVVIAYLDAKHIKYIQVDREVTIEFPNGKSYAGIIAGQTELASKIPTQLSKPFEQQKSMMKVTVEFVNETPDDFQLIEGLPLKVLF